MAPGQHNKKIIARVLRGVSGRRGGWGDEGKGEVAVGRGVLEGE